MPLTAQEAAYIRQLEANQRNMQSQIQALMARGARGGGTDRDDEDPADAGGRLINYTLSGDLTFTAANQGLRSSPISMAVNTDGPFYMTHYPAFSWYASAPSNADNFGKWKPVSSYPLPAQQGGLSAANAESTLYDIIDIAYEIADGGSQRGFQNLVVGPHLMSTRDNMNKMPRKTRFPPNTTIQIYVTFLHIFFGTAPTNDTTGGTLHVDIPGYRIVSAGL